MLRKAWRIIDGDIYLYKANTYGYANAGNEMVKWNETECVRSKLFTSEEFGYLAMTEYLTRELGSKTKWRYNDVCRVIPDRCISQLNDLMLFDFIIENKDRHFSNFGFLINNDIGEDKKYII